VAHSAAHASSSLADCGDGCAYDRTDMPGRRMAANMHAGALEDC
jgi:hypothetical protein